MNNLSTTKRAASSQTMNSAMTTPSRATPGRASIHALKRRLKGAVSGLSMARDIYRRLALASSADVTVLSASAMATANAM